jgi:dihydroceramidase
MYLKNIVELPSSISWCEKKNTHSEYISEFFNTITGVALCVVSIVNFYENKKSRHTILYFSNYILFIVGVGTMLFHGTLFYVFQLLDELPMLLIAIDYYNIFIQLNIFKKTFTTQFYHINTDLHNVFDLSTLNFYHISIVIIYSYFITPRLQIIFFQGFLTIVICTLYFMMYFINNNLNNLFYNKLYKLKTNYFDEKSYDEKKEHDFCTSSLSLFYRKKRSFDIISFLRKINNVKLETNHNIYKPYFTLKYKLKNFNKIGIYIFVFSLIIWNIENMYCSNVQFLQLHAWWHIFTSIGMYYFNNIMKTLINLDKII